jgi:SAM-dependent methyltransferase
VSFTGERYIPGQGGCQLVYEHLHRYLFALRWAAEAQVLDLACGNGYGAAILARRARHVWALDIDGDTVAGAGKEWHSDNLTFIQGDAACLPFRSGTIGLIVAMEALEHIKDQERLLQEIARVCGMNGVALISTPNKAEYSDSRGYTNPFHIRELYHDEFISLLKSCFPYIEIAGQRIHTGSLITHNAAASSCEVIAEPVPGVEKASSDSMYYIAICCNEPLAKPIPAYSAYLDTANGLVHEIRQEAEQEINKLNDEIKRLGRWGRGLEGIVEEKDQAIRDLQTKTMEEIHKRDQIIRSLQEEMDRRITDLLNLLHQKEKEFDERGKWALSLQAEVERLVKIRSSSTYRILSRLGLLPK